MSDLYIKTPWERAGAYDERSQSFIVRRIPAPPEARAVVEDSLIERARRMTYQIRHACPKCLEPAILTWDHSITDTARESMRGEWPAMKALDVLSAQVSSLSRERDAAWASERRARDTANANAAGMLAAREAADRLRAILSTKKRKAKATEAQRAKEGARRRRNAR